MKNKKSKAKNNNKLENEKNLSDTNNDNNKIDMKNIDIPKKINEENKIKNIIKNSLYSPNFTSKKTILI